MDLTVRELERRWRGNGDEDTAGSLLQAYFRAGRFNPGQVIQVAASVRLGRAMRELSTGLLSGLSGVEVGGVEVALNEIVTYKITTTEILNHLLVLERSTDPLPIGSLVARLGRGEPDPPVEPLFGYRDCPHCKGEGVVRRPSDGRTFDCPFCEERSS